MEILWAWLEVRIEREGQDDPVHFRVDQAGAAGAHLRFSPLALFDARQPRALRGPAFEPRSVVARIE